MLLLHIVDLPGLLGSPFLLGNTLGAALLRKCINPLWYFHPQAAKYRGLCEADAVTAVTSTGDSLLFGTANPRCGQREALEIISALCGKTAPQSFRSLPRKRSFQRPGVGEKHVCVSHAADSDSVHFQCRSCPVLPRRFALLGTLAVKVPAHFPGGHIPLDGNVVLVK